MKIILILLLASFSCTLLSQEYFKIHGDTLELNNGEVIREIRIREEADHRLAGPVRHHDPVLVGRLTRCSSCTWSQRRGDVECDRDRAHQGANHLQGVHGGEARSGLVASSQ